jgi:hypothetical protein
MRLYEIEINDTNVCRTCSRTDRVLHMATVLDTFTFWFCPRPILLILLDKVRMQNDAYVNHEGLWGNGISTAQLRLKLSPIWR